MRSKIKRLLSLFTLLLVLLLFFQILFIIDNKYTTKAPFGQAGVLSLSSNDLQRNTPIFLIDGWELYDGTITPDMLKSPHILSQKRPTYIGEFSNYQRGDLSKSPLGSATYRLLLHYSGEAEVVTVVFPEVFSRYSLWVCGEPVQEGLGTAQVTFLLKEGQNEILLNVTSLHGYYSGMYFPGMLGRPETILKAERIKTAFYSFAFLCPLTLALFSLLLWNNKKNKMHRYFGLLCISFSLYVSYYFVHLWKLPFTDIWYLFEDCTFYALCYFAVRLTLEAASMHKPMYIKPILFTSVLMPALEILLYLMTSQFTWAAFLHGKLQNVYRIFLFSFLLLSSVHVFKTDRLENNFILAGNTALGLGILINLLNTNLFEPAYSLWQFEWCGLFLVLLFGAMMAAQNKRILSENAAYATGLEAMVSERTQQLSYVLEERRQFFSDMAHDLKAPLFATKTFVEMIKRHSVGVDDELRYYLAQVERKQYEMSKRVQSLNELTAIDKITTEKELISVNGLLRELYETHNPDVAVSEIHLVTQPIKNDCHIFMQQEKLSVAFENLIYNAIRATPKNGTITLSAEGGADTVSFLVSDTGCGIAEEELPLLFNRFYVGENNKLEGSGLGLYIVKQIIEEAGGFVSVSSKLGIGTTFSMVLPVHNNG
ncbi:MAG: HAMP domain-containing sensor histidine kinase [Angelakisella sp.]